MTFVEKLMSVALHGGDVMTANVLTMLDSLKVVMLYPYSRWEVDIVHAQHQECTVITASVV